MLDDDDHSVEYVIKMIKELFGKPDTAGLQIAKQVHEQGRCIVGTYALEVAELKQEQIHAYGPDKLIPRCQGSMTAELEPAA